MEIILQGRNCFLRNGVMPRRMKTKSRAISSFIWIIRRVPKILMMRKMRIRKAMRTMDVVSVAWLTTTTVVLTTEMYCYHWETASVLDISYSGPLWELVWVLAWWVAGRCRLCCHRS